MIREPDDRVRKEEKIMFEVTQKADEKIQEFFKGNEDTRNIRIFLSEGG